MDVQKHSVHTLVFRSLKRTHDMFLSDQDIPLPWDDDSRKKYLNYKVSDEYRVVKNLADNKNRNMNGSSGPVTDTYPSGQLAIMGTEGDTGSMSGTYPYPSGPGVSLGPGTSVQSGRALVQYQEGAAQGAGVSDIRARAGLQERYMPPGSNKALVSIGDQKMLVPKKAPTMPKPVWHPPYKLFRVISGHQGWVRCVAVEPGNEWFVTGSADRIIKIWDLATGTLKLSLTGHISTVRGVAVSARQPYLFSCAEDKQVKCWDLEYNKVIRHYHGHLSAVYSIDLHPTIDVLITAGRDATCRGYSLLLETTKYKIYTQTPNKLLQMDVYWKVWDMRTKAQVHCLAGHTNTVSQCLCQAAEPQVITASHDCTIRLWDLSMGRTRVTLTNHKKSVRAIAIHPSLHAMVSASPDNIKQWRFPDGNFIQNLSGHNAIVNTLSMNQDSVIVSGGDNGSLYFWDWKSGYNFQRLATAVQPGSIDSENGIFASTFDKSGTRLLTCEADKTIKIYKEDDTATEESHPINWKPDIIKKKQY